MTLLEYVIHLRQFTIVLALYHLLLLI